MTFIETPMELNGEVQIAAPQERVWAALNDAQVMKACIPGCEEIEDESPTERKVRMMLKMGPVRARFNGRVRLSDVMPPASCTMTFEGSGGAAGMASGVSHIGLTEHGAATRLTYTVKASVGGKLGQIGGRMIDASAKQLADQFFRAFGEHLAPTAVPRPALAPETSPAPAPDMPGTLQSATSVSLTAPRTDAAPSPVAPPAAPTEATRILWFSIGFVCALAGVWIGSQLR